MNQIVVAATLPDGRHGWFWSPLDPSAFPDLEWPDGRLTASEPLALCAMTASKTVQVTFEDWFVPESCWLMETDSGRLQILDRQSVLAGASLPLGCGAAGVRVLVETARKRNLPFAMQAATCLEAELEALRTAMRHHRGGDDIRALAVRVGAIDLAWRSAQAAVAAASGSANQLSHPAQRLMREATFYSVQAQNRGIMEATLNHLSRPRVQVWS
ncbi:MAG: hypothetical protein ACYCW6_16675 [Candidatus Xenobia bacterium]